jgi:hypothetical protein
MCALPSFQRATPFRGLDQNIEDGTPLSRRFDSWSSGGATYPARNGLTSPAWMPSGTANPSKSLTPCQGPLLSGQDSSSGLGSGRVRTSIRMAGVVGPEKTDWFMLELATHQRPLDVLRWCGRKCVSVCDGASAGGPSGMSLSVIDHDHSVRPLRVSEWRDPPARGRRLSSTKRRGNGFERLFSTSAG